MSPAVGRPSRRLAEASMGWASRSRAPVVLSSEPAVWGGCVPSGQGCE